VVMLVFIRLGLTPSWVLGYIRSRIAYDRDSNCDRNELRVALQFVLYHTLEKYK
jgi:hypothetical protein